MATKWTANTLLSKDAIIVPTSGDAGLFFRVTTTNTTTGSSEPNWATTIGETVYDNDVRYVSFSATFSSLQSLNPSAIIELFVIELSSSLHGTTVGSSGESNIFRFHAGSNLNVNKKIIWDQKEYLRFPIEATGFSFQRGQQPRPKLIVSNATSLISALLLQVNKTTAGNDLTGAKVTRIRTLAKFIDAVNFADGQNSTADPTAEFPREIYTIDRKASENRFVVEFELAMPTDLAGITIPKRQCTRRDFKSIGTFS